MVKAQNQSAIYSVDSHIKLMKEYVTWVKKHETPEQSREALIRTGVLDKSGKLIIRHK